MAYLEERIDTVEGDIAEIKGDIHQVRNTQVLHGEVLARHTEQLDALRTGQEELRAGHAQIMKALAEFRSALNVILGEVEAQKAWREEFSSKVARLVAKNEGVEG